MEIVLQKKVSFIITLYKRRNFISILDLDVYRIDGIRVPLNDIYWKYEQEPLGFICGPDGRDIPITSDTLIQIEKHFIAAKDECRNVKLSYSYKRHLYNHIRSLDDDEIKLNIAVARLKYIGEESWL